jgi:DNA polymerase-3 subunit chi
VTEVAFHFNTADKLEYACRLLRKAYAASAKVIVTGDLQQMQLLDHNLWTFDNTSFIPHCTSNAATEILEITPVILFQDSELPQSLPHHEVLLNLGHSLVNGFETFERIIEVVSMEEEDKITARKRWKHYSERGYQLVRHDLSIKSSVQ